MLKLPVQQWVKVSGQGMNFLCEFIFFSFEYLSLENEVELLKDLRLWPKFWHQLHFFSLIIYALPLICGIIYSFSGGDWRIISAHNRKKVYTPFFHLCFLAFFFIRDLTANWGLLTPDTFQQWSETFLSFLWLSKIQISAAICCYMHFFSDRYGSDSSFV